eukprot:NODE_3479_length_1212_cov_48.942149_g3301_i0.p1 GENE.NODE_3479_length_1212_cov_48.942149_g3301_i0~~NODE_3479_length_1212_cov_48.942149_g3301_i0.p1  ORF type:complete len:349 (-),score=82.95 NODE_3479_length_1212_cov_48.942149_g3301_i0:166-1155(-)
MAVVLGGTNNDAQVSAFVSREVHGDEIRDGFIDRHDKLNSRMTSKVNKSTLDDFARGRPDHLKSYEWSHDGCSEIHDLCFYKRPNQAVRYKHETVSGKEEKTLRFACTYAPDSADEDPCTLRSIQLKKGVTFSPDLHPPSYLKKSVHMLTEEFIPSKTQPYVRYQHDFVTNRISLTMWPDGVFESCYTGDPDVDVHGEAVHIFDTKGVVMEIRNDPTSPSVEQLADEWSWVLHREQVVMLQVLAMERSLSIFMIEQQALKGPERVQDAQDHVTRLEALVQRLCTLVDECDLRGVAGDHKGENYDGLQRVMQDRVAQLEQEVQGTGLQSL